MTGWTVTLACTRAEAEAIPGIGEPFADLADPPTVMVDEPDPHRPDDWVLVAYCNARPDAGLTARIAALAPSAGGVARVEPLPDEDWTVLSQRGLEPVRAGRFVAHTRAHREAVRAGDIGIEIEAGLAFGTGQHATTHGCLAAIDALAKRRRFATIVDLGTGSGILAIAALKAWPGAAVAASDIDPVAVTVTRANLALNRVRRGRRQGAVELLVAAGARHRRLAERGPHDLVIANILAGPLVAMSRDVARAVAPGGVLILAGLLDTQARRVRAAYRRQGLVPLRQHPRGEWPVLVLARPVRHARHGTAASR